MKLGQNALLGYFDQVSLSPFFIRKYINIWVEAKICMKLPPDSALFQGVIHANFCLHQIFMYFLNKMDLRFYSHFLISVKFELLLNIVSNPISFQFFVILNYCEMNAFKHLI